MNNEAHILLWSTVLAVERRVHELMANHFSKMPGRSNATANIIRHKLRTQKKQVQRSTTALNRGTRGLQPQHFLAMLQRTIARSKLLQHGDATTTRTKSSFQLFFRLAQMTSDLKGKFSILFRKSLLFSYCFLFLFGYPRHKRKIQPSGKSA